jgi:predicted Fe-S protein YdhL (DUF1289 family)
VPEDTVAQIAAKIGWRAWTPRHRHRRPRPRLRWHSASAFTGAFLCISVARSTRRTGLCAAARTPDEIAVWSMLDDGERREVWARIDIRRAQGGVSGEPEE